MSDIAERVRALCPHDVSGYCECTAQEAADVIETLRGELAAAQTREKVLRNQMRRIIGDHIAPEQCYSTGPLHCDWRDESCPSCEGLALLAQPTDDTALKAALANERERCAKVCDGYTWADAAASSIRALGEE